MSVLPTTHMPTLPHFPLLVTANVPYLREIEIHEGLHELWHGNGGRVEIPESDGEGYGDVPHLEVCEYFQQRY